jgi:urocanate hydratase
VLWNDPASGVWRHADAGYEDAIALPRHGLRLPRILHGLNLPGILG